MKIGDLKILLEVLLSKLGSMDNSRPVFSDQDLYWNITDEELYDPYKKTC